jgi:hypothetical protein
LGVMTCLRGFTDGKVSASQLPVQRSRHVGLGVTVCREERDDVPGSSAA